MGLLASLPAVADGPACPGASIDDPAIAAAWQAVRTLDCARCHGKDLDGLAAPSILDYVRSQDRAQFERIVLDGNPPRGMPAYRANPLVAGAVDGLYRYFVARASGALAATARPARRAPDTAAPDYGCGAGEADRAGRR